MRTFEHNDVIYHWFGGFGAVFKSFERGVRRGDVRYILNRLFYAYLVYPKWFVRPEVCWTLTGEFDAATIREVQREAFGVECCPSLFDEPAVPPAPAARREE